MLLTLARLSSVQNIDITAKVYMSVMGLKEGDGADIRISEFLFKTYEGGGRKSFENTILKKWCLIMNTFNNDNNEFLRTRKAFLCKLNPF